RQNIRIYASPLVFRYRCSYKDAERRLLLRRRLAITATSDNSSKLSATQPWISKTASRHSGGPRWENRTASRLWLWTYPGQSLAILTRGSVSRPSNRHEPVRWNGSKLG